MLGLEIRAPEELGSLKLQKQKECSIALFRSTKGASKQRRDMINSEIGNLRDMLPLPESARQRLSQLQIMSLACVYIRKCNYFTRLFGNSSRSTETPFEFAQSMNGFLLTTTRDGKLLYISENVTEYLGHSMVDMLTQGDSIYDIIDKRDHGTVQSELVHTTYSASGTAPGISEEKTFFCRMNVSRSFRRQAGFGDHKVMHVRGHFVTPMICDHYGNQPVFTAICSPLITPDVKDTIIQNNTMIFQSVHGLDMKYMEMAHNGEHHLEYTDEEIKGKSWYELLHPEDLAEAKEKHIQLIKSSHEMGCMLTVRLMSKYGDWVWVNMVMHIRQPFLCDNADPAIVCINHVIQEPEAQSFKLQSQLYSSHIARSPEIFSSPSGDSPPHTITQVPAGDRDKYMQGGSHSEESTSYQGEIRLALLGPASTMTSSRASMDQIGSHKASTSSQSDNGPDKSLQDQKQILRADLFSRLKRKLSESKEQCKPAKIAKYQSEGGGKSPQRDDISYMGTVSFGPMPAESSVALDDGIFAIQGLGPVVHAPAYMQLKPDINLNPKEQLLVQDLIQPATPMTPESMSDPSSPSEITILNVDVSDIAVVPCSVLTPDSSPACSPAQVLSPLNIADLENVSFFAEMKNIKPVEPEPVVKMEIKKEKPTLLPEIDVMCLEQYLGQLETPDMLISEEDIKKEVEEEEEVTEEVICVEDLLSVCDNHNLAVSLAASLMDMVQMMETSESVLNDVQEKMEKPETDPMMTMALEKDENDLINTTNLSPSHGDLLNELHQLNQLAANSTPSYGEEELAGGLFNSTL